MAKSSKKINHPENRLIKRNLLHGDVKLLAKKTKYKPSSIYQILSGYRAMPDSLANAIVQLVSERRTVRKSLASLSIDDN